MPTCRDEKQWSAWTSGAHDVCACVSTSPCSSHPSDWTWLGIHRRLLNNTGGPTHRHGDGLWNGCTGGYRKCISRCRNTHIAVGITVHFTAPVWSTLSQRKAKSTNKRHYYKIYNMCICFFCYCIWALTVCVVAGKDLELGRPNFKI